MVQKPVVCKMVGAPEVWGLVFSAEVKVAVGRNLETVLSVRLSKVENSLLPVDNAGRPHLGSASVRVLSQFGSEGPRWFPRPLLAV